MTQFYLISPFFFSTRFKTFYVISAGQWGLLRLEYAEAARWMTHLNHPGSSGQCWRSRTSPKCIHDCWMCSSNYPCTTDTCSLSRMLITIRNTDGMLVQHADTHNVLSQQSNSPTALLHYSGLLPSSILSRNVQNGRLHHRSIANPRHAEPPATHRL
jgi:hypothetical protein